MITIGDKIDYEKGRWIVSSVIPDKSLIYVEQEAARNQGRGKWLRVVTDGFVPFDPKAGEPLIQVPQGLVQ